MIDLVTTVYSFAWVEPWQWLILGVVGWVLVAVGVGKYIAATIRLADRRESTARHRLPDHFVDGEES